MALASVMKTVKPLSQTIDVHWSRRIEKYGSVMVCVGKIIIFPASMQTCRPCRWLPEKNKVQSAPKHHQALVSRVSVFQYNDFVLESSTSLYTSRPILSKHLTVISKVMSRNGSYVSETALQFKHLTGIKIQMLNNRCRRLSMPI